MTSFSRKRHKTHINWKVNNVANAPSRKQILCLFVWKRKQKKRRGNSLNTLCFQRLQHFILSNDFFYGSSFHVVVELLNFFLLFVESLIADSNFEMSSKWCMRIKILIYDLATNELLIHCNSQFVIAFLNCLRANKLHCDRLFFFFDEGIID